MKSLSLLTFGLGLLTANLAHAAQNDLSYYTVDTTNPMTNDEIQSLCNQQTDIVQATLTGVSTRLTGSATTLQVIGFYGQEPSTDGPVNSTNPTIESYCYLTFHSNDPNVLFDAYSAVHFTHLTSTTWNTACEPVYEQVLANPDTLITNYSKTATLFQGRICEVTTVQAVQL